MDTSRSGTTRYSVPQVARMLGISERAVRKQIESGKLHADRAGRRWIITLAEPKSDQGSESCGNPAIPEDVTSGTEEEPIEVDYRSGATEASQRYLAELRDQWLMPLIRENGELQKTIGRLEAEREQLRSERDELRARLKPILLRQGAGKASDDDQVKSDQGDDLEGTTLPWWRFWNRGRA